MANLIKADKCKNGEVVRKDVIVDKSYAERMNASGGSRSYVIKTSKPKAVKEPKKEYKKSKSK